MKLKELKIFLPAIKYDPIETNFFRKILVQHSVKIKNVIKGKVNLVLQNIEMSTDKTVEVRT